MLCSSLPMEEDEPECQVGAKRQRTRVSKTVQIMVQVEFVTAVRDSNLDEYCQPLGGERIVHFIKHTVEYKVTQMWRIVKIWRHPTSAVHLSADERGTDITPAIYTSVMDAIDLEWDSLSTS